MGSERKDLGKSVFQERKLEGGGRRRGTQSQGRATHLSPGNRKLLRPLVAGFHPVWPVEFIQQVLN